MSFIMDGIKGYPVDLTGILENYVLTWDSVNKKWVPTAKTGGLSGDFVLEPEVTVYKSAGTYYAMQDEGTILDSNADDKIVIDSAISAVSGAGGGTIYCKRSGSPYTLQDIDILSNVELKFHPTAEVQPSNASTYIFRVRPNGKYEGGWIRCLNALTGFTFTNRAFVVDGDDQFEFANEFSSIKHVRMEGDKGSGKGTAIYFRTSGASHYLQDFLTQHIHIDGFTNGIHLKTEHATAYQYINACTFKDIKIFETVNELLLDSYVGNSSAEISSNYFLNFQGSYDPSYYAMAIKLSGKCYNNFFFPVTIWDLQDASAALEFGSATEANTFFGTLKYTAPAVVDNGTGNNVIDGIGVRVWLSAVNLKLTRATTDVAGVATGGVVCNINGSPKRLLYCDG